MKRLGIDRADWLAGGTVMAIGLFTLLEGMSYPIGTTRVMGPGYFPVALGLVMIGFGAGIILVEGRKRQSTPMPKFAVRGVLAVIGSMLAFTFLIERAGLAPAVFTMIMICAFAERNVRIVRTFITAVVLTIASIAIFVVGLKVPLQVVSW